MSGSSPPMLHASQPLPTYLALLAASQASGVLAATSDGSRREIVLVNGEIRATRSALEEEKLGMWLVQRGHISEDDRALTLLSQGASDAPPLGHLLVTRGKVSQQVLEAELQELALTILRRACAAPEAACEFHAGRDADQLDTLPNLTTPQIVLEAARAFTNLEAARTAVGSFEQNVWLAQGVDSLLQELALTPTEFFVLSRLDRQRTLSSLVKLAGLPEDQALATLYVLIVCGILRLGAAPHPAPVGPRWERAATEPSPPVVDETRLTSDQREERSTIRKLAAEATRVDHYRALGIRPGANTDRIEEAWRAIEARCGPERAAESHLRDLRTEIDAIRERAREAYQVLRSFRTRERYDTILESVTRDRQSLDTGRVRTETDPGVRSEIVEANIKRSDELVKDGELYPAIQLLEQACALEPRPPELLKLSRLLLRNPLWTNRALSCIRRAIEVDPKYVDAWLELAEFWRRRHHNERQRKALERALAVDPDSDRANQMYKQLVGRRELDRLLKRARQAKS